MSLFVLGLGFSAQASCPDVSGRFGAMCTQVKTCTGTSSQVYVGFDIVQNGCNEVTIQRLSPFNAVLTTTYPVGTASRSRSNLNTFLSYNDQGLTFSMGGSRSSITSF
jgi:hypothetical protein